MASRIGVVLASSSHARRRAASNAVAAAVSSSIADARFGCLRLQGIPIPEMAEGSLRLTIPSSMISKKSPFIFLASRDAGYPQEIYVLLQALFVIIQV